MRECPSANHQLAYGPQREISAQGADGAPEINGTAAQLRLEKHIEETMPTKPWRENQEPSAAGWVNVIVLIVLVVAATVTVLTVAAPPGWWDNLARNLPHRWETLLRLLQGEKPDEDLTPLSGVGFQPGAPMLSMRRSWWRC